MSVAKTISIQQLKTVCSTCSLRELCLPMGLSPDEIDRLDHLVYTRKKIKKGESLYRAGDPFMALRAVRTGFFKSTMTLEDGRDQVTGFHMAGEVIGMDGIGTDSHTVSLVALEDSEVCVIPFGRLEELTHEVRSLQNQFHKLMSRELVRDQGLMMMLGTMRAEERVAAFLLNLSQRFGARGYSPNEFTLRMTREELGSFLGLKLETVSRIFSKFQEQGLVEVQQKRIRIHEVNALKKMLGREC